MDGAMSVQEPVISTNPVEPAPQNTESITAEPVINSLLTGEKPKAVESNNSNSLLTEDGDGAPTEPDASKVEVPEAYEIKVSEGYELSPEVMETITPLFKKHNISKEGAQELAEAHMEIMRKQSAAAEQFRSNLIKGWVDEIKKDPEFGGAKFDENMALARRGLRAINPPGEGKSALNELLEMSGMGNNPEIIKAFARVGKLVKEDSILDKGSIGGPKKEFDPNEMFSVSLS